MGKEVLQFQTYKDFGESLFVAYKKYLQKKLGLLGGIRRPCKIYSYGY